MEFVELNGEEYDAYARKHPYRNYLNSEKAFALKEQYGFKTKFVGVKENGNIRCATGIAFTPMMKKFYYAYAQRGFLIDYNDRELLTFFTTNLVSYLKNKAVIYVKLDPYVQYQQRDNGGAIVENGFKNEYIMNNLASLGYQHQGFTLGFSPDSQVRWMVALDIEHKSEAELLKAMDLQKRRSINKVTKLGIKVREMDYEELPEFKKIMDFASASRNFTDLSLAHYQQQMNMFGEDAKIIQAYLDLAHLKEQYEKELSKACDALTSTKSAIITASDTTKLLKKEKQLDEEIKQVQKKIGDLNQDIDQYGSTIVLAVAYFILYEDEVIYVSGGAYDEFRKYNGSYAIQWHMIRYALEHGYKRYNFYGTSGVFTEDAQDYGVFEFKKGFRGCVEEYVGEFILPVSKTKYKLYSSIKNIRHS